MTDPRPGSTPPARPGRLRRVTAVCSWLYLAAVVALWLILLRAESWWPATFLMFSPRWAFGLPLAALMPAAAFARSIRLLAVLLVAGVVVAGPVMSFNVPWSLITSDRPAGKPFRIMTLNMHYANTAPKALENQILLDWPDVVAVQEWRGAEATSLRKEPEWHIHSNPRLFLASRHPIRKTVELGDNSMGEHASAVRYELETPLGVVHVINLHAATTRRGFSDALRDSSKGPAEIRANSMRRRQQLAFIAREAAALDGPVLIMGDFNTPPESPIFDEVLHGYTDAFAAAGWGWGYTFVGAKTTVRIDHILAGRGWGVAACRVGPNVGSPHRPVLADLVWMGR
jgi:endonuclease/exonuclease/phosphatase (EEP) superfamily protein YafD